MGDFIFNLILVDNIPVIQLTLIAYVGALFGEMRKEADENDGLVFWKFVVSWLSSGFGGVMIGLAIRGFAKENEFIWLAGAGISGYAGHKKTMGMSLRFLESYVQKIVNNSKDKDTS